MRIWTEELPKYFKGRRKNKDRKMIARYICGNKARGGQYWMKEDNRRYKLCEEEKKTIRHVLEKCKRMNERKELEEILEDKNQGLETMKRIEKL